MLGSNINISEIISKFPKILGFIVHGFTPSEINETEARGICLFCGKEKMYVSLSKGLWDCKYGCGGGSYWTFLREISAYYKLDITSKKLNELSKNRSIPKEVLYTHNVGYNTVTEEYLIPEIYKEKIIDVKRFKINEETKSKRFISSPNVKKNIWLGVDYEITETIIIVEGEWDFFVLKYVFGSKYTIVMLPGANQYKEEYNEMFSGKDVIVILDNDKSKTNEAGKLIAGAAALGSYKIHQNLSYIVKSIKFKHWDSEINGYDIRDLWIDCSQKVNVFKMKLFSNLHDYPKDFDMVSKSKNTLLKKSVSYEKVYEVFNKWLMLEDTSIIDAVYGSVFGNRLQSDPLWLFIVARSGFAKSEFLMALTEVPFIYAISSLTPNSLISGARGKDGSDPSLIPKLKNKTLVIKDFTTVMSLDPLAVRSIFGTLRDAYDGTIKRATGTISRGYDSKFGILSGVTPVIYNYVEENTAYGERFLMYRVNDEMELDTEISIIRAAMANSGKESSMRDELKGVSNCVFAKQITYTPYISSELEKRIAYASCWLSRFRGTAKRDKYRSGEIQSHAIMEIGTRSSKQIAALLRGIALFKDQKEVDMKEFETVKKVMLSSANIKYKSVYDYIRSKGIENTFSKNELIKSLGLGEKMGEKVIEDMCLFKIIKSTEIDSKTRLYNTKYRVTEDIQTITKEIF